MHFKKINFLWIFKRYKCVKTWSDTSWLMGVKLYNGHTEPTSAREGVWRVNRKTCAYSALRGAVYLFFFIPPFLIKSPSLPSIYPSMHLLIDFSLAFCFSVPVLVIVIFSLRWIFLAADLRLIRHSVSVSALMSRRRRRRRCCRCCRRSAFTRVFPQTKVDTRF